MVLYLYKEVLMCKRTAKFTTCFFIVFLLFFTVNNYGVKAYKKCNEIYDFEKDEHLIFSAFYRTYKIDIEQELDYLHWWKFKAMFNDLDSESKFVGTYMYYRGLDISESIIFKNANEREKQRMLEMIRYVSLENDDESRSVKDEEIERIKQKRLEILAKQKGV